VFWNFTLCRAVIRYDISGQTIGPIYKGRDVLELLGP